MQYERLRVLHCRTIMSANLSLILLATLTLLTQAFAQNPPQPLKFDEFDDQMSSGYFSFTEETLTQHITRLVFELKKDRGRRVYIIYYQARKLNDVERYKISNWAEQTKWELVGKANLRDEQVTVIDGGRREQNTLEYWIGARDSDRPPPTPTYSESESAVCPRPGIRADGIFYDPSKPVRITAWTPTGYSGTFHWQVLAGRIVEGQGTSTITVDLSQSESAKVTAYVELSGLSPLCDKSFYGTVSVGNFPILWDSGSRYNYSDLAARVDAFMVLLNNNPELRGFIAVYASRRSGPREQEMALNSVNRMFAFRRYSFDRVTVVKAGYREYNSFDMWVLPPGSESPKLTPSVDSRFILTRRTNSKRRNR